jgi:hypothetical protein
MATKKPNLPSSFQFLLLAEASLDAANAAYLDCQRRDREFDPGTEEDLSTFMSIPVAFLYFRSVELALKAAIVERSLASPKDVPSHKLGHDIKSLIHCATIAGATGAVPFDPGDLGVDPAARAFLESFSDDYANKWFEYHFGPWDIPDLHRCQQVATSIIEAVKPIARTLQPPGNP